MGQLCPNRPYWDHELQLQLILFIWDAWQPYLQIHVISTL